MHRIDHSTNNASLPAPDAAGTPGYFKKGDPGLGIPATIVTQDWANDVQENLVHVILTAGGSLTKGRKEDLYDALIALINGASLGFSTGDVKATFKTVADAGWVWMNDGSIGSAVSGATTRANADTEALYTLLWNNVSDSWAPVSGGRGANAAADFAANKTLTLPRALGRALAVAGAGSGLTARALGQYLGAETHQLSQAETPVKSHTHGVTDPGHGHGVTDPGHAHSGVGSLNQDDIAGGAQGQYGNAINTGSSATGIIINNNTTGISVNAAADASATAHNNMPPETFLNVMIKL